MLSSKSDFSRTIALVAMIALLPFVAGCGSDKSSGPGGPIFNPQGTGSGTMLVIADVSGADVGPGIFTTDFTVTLSDGLSNPVTGATVQITIPTGILAIPEDGGSPGIYKLTTSGYVAGGYTLNVVRGTDNVANVVVVAPDVHGVVSPAANDTVSTNQSLAVSWTRSSAALEATIESRDYVSPNPEADDGLSLVPASGNPVRNNQRIRVFRLNRTTVAGGLPGSRFEAKLRNSVEPVIAL